MSSLSHLIRALSGQPLAVDPRFLAAFRTILASHLAGERFSGERLHADLGIEAASSRERLGARELGIAVIPIIGVVAQRAQSLGASTDEIGAMLDTAVASKAVGGILLEVDSPGGTVSGVPELAAKIRQADQVKPVFASVNSLAASAGYWLASQAREIIITPSGEAGSIGVYTYHADLSKALEQDGIAITAMSAGKFKLEGAPWAPLSEEAQAVIQAQVDEAYGWFIQDVAATRAGGDKTAIRNGFGQGRVLSAKEAKKAGLVDRIGTFDEAAQRLADRLTARRRSAVAVERERRALDGLAATL